MSKEKDALITDKLEKAFKFALENVIDHKYEPDKIHCDISHLQQAVILELYEKRKQIEQLKAENERSKKHIKFLEENMKIDIGLIKAL